MDGLMEVALKDLPFFGYHGLYDEEKKTGNEFRVNLSVFYTPLSGTITHISDTINYAALYALLKKEMQQPRQLLETLAMEISEAIHLSYPLIKRIEISISKMQVPVIGFRGYAAVSYQKEY